MKQNANPERQLADEFIRSTGSHLFLTGKAGTGKTTFLHDLKRNPPKRMVITAPTGVAAINAGGVTLHSFFQLPFGPYLAENGLQEQRRFTREKINIIKSLELLVIDEISMVRSDLLDAVDAVLRRYKNPQQPFGGVQLLMIGDLHQLSPVVKEDEWALLKDAYDSCYFFSSHALKQAQMITIELKIIYRQSDARFIELLNRVRDNRLDNETLGWLNTRYLPDFQPTEGEGYITLTTHNRSADRINEQQLRLLHTKPIAFQASVEGDFPSYNYPTAESLVLKKGAQVMFVRNDSGEAKRYFNGKIGKVTHVDPGCIKVKCPDDKDEIEVESLTWENIKYTVDKKSGDISDEVIGRFTQIPLRPAWAITVHKSQGLTFERAVIDVNAAFSHGQVYVALSRCKTFEGMVLSTPISSHAVKTDRTVTHFVEQTEESPPDREMLDAAKISFQHQLLLACFDFQPLGNALGKLASQLRTQRRLINCTGLDTLEQMMPQLNERVVGVASKFQRQLGSLFKQNSMPEEDPHIQERVRKASHYFTEQLQAELTEWVAAFKLTTDNRELKKQISKAHGLLQHQLAIKTAALKSCRDGFFTGSYLNAVARAELDVRSPAASKSASAALDTAEVAHPALLQMLIAWRKKQAADEQLAHYRILHQRVLMQIAEQLPGTLDALMALKGIGKHTAQKYGKPIVAMVNSYCRDHNLKPQQTTPPSPAKSRSDHETKQISYELFLEGKSIKEIAADRELVVSTIEGHLSYYVEQGELDLVEIMGAEKITTIRVAIGEIGRENLKALKERLGDDYTYGEIKLVLASHDLS